MRLRRPLIAIAAFATLAMPSTSAAAQPVASRVAGIYENALRAAGIEPHSRHPSGTRPYAVCPAPTESQLTCMSAVVPEALAARERTTKSGPLLEGSGELGGYSPADLRAAYNLPSAGGEGLTIAITIAFDYPTAESDLAIYRQTYGLPSCTAESGCFAKVNQAGNAGEYPEPNSSWAAEAALDLDMASAICPKCRLLLVEADDNGLENLPLAVNRAATLGADVISDSWGGEEFPEEPTLDSHLHHPGVPVLFASGDDGFIPSYPATSPDVIAVGGTSLGKDQSARGWREKAWAGAGSGCSEYEQKPSWQTDAGCANRVTADVAAVADPETPVSVYDSYGGYGGWLLFGGTSVSTPLMAGVEALLSVAERSAGAQRYWELGEGGDLFDVTEGRNGTCAASVEYLCLAGMGYDGPTGWGTPGGSRPGPPVVATEVAAPVTPSEATLRGSINPNGHDTSFRFEYGTTTGYGTSVPLPDEAIGAGEVPVQVTESLTNLARNTTYHYRVVATNDAGTTYGGDRTFVTSPWSWQDMPRIAGGGELFGDSCASATFCDAVGAQDVYFEGPFYNEAPVAQRWDGSSWVKESPPILHAPAAGYASRLEDVSCVSATACLAIGENYEIGVGYGPLAEQWNGSGWTILPVPVPPEAALNQNGTYEVRMHAVSCVSQTFCMAAGEVTTGWESLSPGEIGSLIEVWDGFEWTAEVPPGPPGWKENLLWGVSCVSNKSCVAVGESRSGGSMKPFVERWDGVGWSIAPSPVSSGGLQGVSCAAEDSCVAVGAAKVGRAGRVLGWSGTGALGRAPHRICRCEGFHARPPIRVWGWAENARPGPPAPSRRLGTDPNGSRKVPCCPRTRPTMQWN